MLGKRAQTEDFLGDLVPALVIIAIAMVIGSVMSSAHISTIEARAAVANIKLNSLDIFSLLHSPVDVGGYKDFSDLLMSLAEAYENRDDEFFKSSSLARMGSEYAECSKVFEDEMDRFFGGKRWTVSVFEIQDMGTYPQKKIFACERLGVEGLQDVKFSEAYLPSSGFTAYKVLVGWKNE